MTRIGTYREDDLVARRAGIVVAYLRETALRVAATFIRAESVSV